MLDIIGNIQKHLVLLSHLGPGYEDKNTHISYRTLNCEIPPLSAIGTWWREKVAVGPVLRWG